MLHGRAVTASADTRMGESGPVVCSVGETSDRAEQQISV